MPTYQDFILINAEGYRQGHTLLMVVDSAAGGALVVETPMGERLTAIPSGETAQPEGRPILNIEGYPWQIIAE
jgi:hypothetical protein